MQYKIIEFTDTKTVAVVPNSWVNGNEVKWHDKLSPTFAKKGLFPKNKWKIYAVKQLTSQIFDAYERAENAMKKIINSNKTDIESEDIMSDFEAITSSNSSKDDDVENPLACIKPSHTISQVSSSEMLSEKANNTASTPVELVVENCTEALELVPQNTLHEILIKLETMANSIKTIESTLQNKDLTRGKKCTCLHFVKNRCNEILPLTDIQDLLKFENNLSNDSDLVVEFQKYLSNSIVPKDLRSFVRIIVSKTYNMELQGKINYTGVKGKQKLKDLLSTDIILRTICEYVPELILLADENEKIGKAEAELKYQLQHFFDRKRSLQKQKAMSTGKKLSSVDPDISAVDIDIPKNTV